MNTLIRKALSTLPGVSPVEPSTLTLRTADDRIVTVQKSVLLESGLIHNLLAADDDLSSIEVPLPNITFATLNLVLEWCRHHEHNPMVALERPLKSKDLATLFPDPFDLAFFRRLSYADAFEVILAANYMAIDPLMKLGCCKIAADMMDKTPNEARAMFGIPAPSEAEEAEIREKNRWVYDYPDDTLA